MRRGHYMRRGAIDSAQHTRIWKAHGAARVRRAWTAKKDCNGVVEMVRQSKATGVLRVPGGLGNSSGKSGGKQGTAHVPTQAGVL